MSLMVAVMVQRYYFVSEHFYGTSGLCTNRLGSPTLIPVTSKRKRARYIDDINSEFKAQSDFSMYDVRRVHAPEIFASEGALYHITSSGRVLYFAYCAQTTRDL